MKRLALIVSLAATLIVLASQEALAQAADDQRILDAGRKALVNVVPVAREFAKNNQAHKILMAVVDTGVDYNHPLLLSNIHFNLDASGKPVGAGWDFTGNDAWPAPLIANSLDLNPKAPADGVANERQLSQVLSEIGRLFPAHQNRLDPRRNIFQEITGGLFHGTHVAGLMVYDEPRLGVLPYRAIPMSIEYNEKGQPTGDGTINIILAIQKAIQDGARVINLSLGMTITKDLEKASPQAYQFQLARIAAVKEMAQKNPNVAFVAATGNEGTWLDDRARLGMPCGIEAQNILCVGATDQEGGLASFSNVVLAEVPFILATGEEIMSLFPTQFCNIQPAFVGSLLNPMLQSNDQMKNFFYGSIAKACTDTQQFYTTTGTSMATPIVARLVGKALLANPSQTGAQAIQAVLNSAEDLKVGRLTMKKLRAEKPSWYPNRAKDPRFLLAPMKSAPQYFEFITR